MHGRVDGDVPLVKLGQFALYGIHKIYNDIINMTRIVIIIIIIMIIIIVYAYHVYSLYIILCHVIWYWFISYYII